MIRQFLNAMVKYVPSDARLMACQFRGDPGDDIPRKWVSRPLTNLKQLDDKANIYLAVSAMRKNARGEYRRRKENFAGGLLLMIDDLGNGPGAKFPLSTIDVLEPTALIETSPDNYQAVYMFDSLVEDMELFNRLIKAFIDKQFLGADTGMAGVNRVFRPPFGINGKAKYGGWTVRGEYFRPKNRYSIKKIAKAFGLDLRPPRPKMPKGATADKAANIRAFVSVRAILRSAGMIKSEEKLEGWIDITCPWVHEHTGAIDNGASIRLPSRENSWFGAFKCHHGNCIDKHWGDLTEWIAQDAADIMETINNNAGEFSDYQYLEKDCV